MSAAAKPAGAGPFSAFERLVAWRYLRSRRKEAFISVIASISFVGIMLGVATLIIVMAVMNGFRAELLTRILGVNGHLILQPRQGGGPLRGQHVLAGGHQLAELDEDGAQSFQGFLQALAFAEFAGAKPA